jgi:hypothetical protein
MIDIVSFGNAPLADYRGASAGRARYLDNRRVGTSLLSA